MKRSEQKIQDDKNQQNNESNENKSDNIEMTQLKADLNSPINDNYL